MNNMNQILDDKLQQIAKEIENLRLPDQPDYGLMGGLSGIMLFLFYYSDCKKSEIHRKLAEDYLEHIVTYINQTDDITISYAEGITGFLSVILHLVHNGYIDKSSVEIDALLIKKIYEVCREGVANKEDDLFYGVGGLLSFLIDKYRFQKELRIKSYISDIVRDLVARKDSDINVFLYYQPLVSTKKK